MDGGNQWDGGDPPKPRGPGRPRKVANDVDGNAASGSPTSDYDTKVDDWREATESRKQTMQHAWSTISRDFWLGIKGIAYLWILPIPMVLLYEYYVYLAHYEMWLRVYRGDRSDLLFANIFAATTVIAMALLCHFAIKFWASKVREGKVSPLLKAITFVFLALYALFFAFEATTFYFTLTKDTIDAFGDVVRGASPEEALAKIGSWAALNFTAGFLTGLVTFKLFKE